MDKEKQGFLQSHFVVVDCRVASAHRILFRNRLKIHKYMHMYCGLEGTVYVVNIIGLYHVLKALKVKKKFQL